MQSEIYFNIIICLGIPWAVFFLLWVKEKKKWERLKGYAMFWSMVSFFSLLLVLLIFGDYDLSRILRSLIVFCFSLMSTFSSYYLILAKGDESEKKKVKELYFKKK